MSEDHILTNPSINFKEGSVMHPTYQFNRMTAYEGLNTYSLNSTSSQQSTFQITPSVYNLSKSFLEYTVFVPAQGAGNSVWMNTNGNKSISRITVSVQSGAVLLDLPNFDRYLDTISRKTMALDDLLTRDIPTDYSAANGYAGNGTCFESLVPSNSATFYVRLDNSAVNRLSEAQYVNSGAANTAYYYDVKLSFKDLIDTFLVVDHDLWFGGNVFNIVIYWNPTAGWIWQGTSTTNPATGATALSVTGANIQNLQLYLAVEQNQDICGHIQAKTKTESGLTLKIPYPYQFPQSLSTGANNPQIQYNSSNGLFLKRLYWTVYQLTLATPNLTYDKNNLASNTKITAFQSFVNSKAIQQNQFVPQNCDDFLFLRDKLRKTAIQSWNEYLYNWIWLEDFTDGKAYNLCKELYPKIPIENCVDEFPMLGSMQYSINATSSSNLLNYVFAIFIRKLKIQGPLTTLI